MLIWNWFSPVVFPSLPGLSYWNAVGLSLVATALFYHPQYDPETGHLDPWEAVIKTALFSAGWYTAVIVFGAVLHVFAF